MCVRPVSKARYTCMRSHTMDRWLRRKEKVMRLSNTATAYIRKFGMPHDGILYCYRVVKLLEFEIISQQQQQQQQQQAPYVSKSFCFKDVADLAECVCALADDEPTRERLVDHDCNMCSSNIAYVHVRE